MQPIKHLANTLKTLADAEHCLFTLNDLRGVLPEQTPAAFKALLSRAEHLDLLKRICRGLYLYPEACPNDGLLLYRAAARLRAGEFNYISLESALSDAGVISQLPINWVTLMSSGRTHIMDCGNFGKIEFIHTKKQAADLANQLVYDTRCHVWRASVALALRDMKRTRRDTDLIDWELADELV
jgi:predicted transcriptional regulator of viral defense system